MTSGSGFSRKYGQVLLVDPNIAKLEVRTLEPKPGDTIIEIGPGTGILTEHLLRTEARIIAVEPDHRFYESLQSKFNENVEDGSLILRKENFLEMEPEKASGIIGNVPYMISSEILFRLLKFQFSRCVLMLQKEFANRMIAKLGSGEYSRLSVTSRLRFNVRLVRTVPRTCFNPRPEVDSAIVFLTVRTDVDQYEVNEAQDLIRKLFSARRKMIRGIVDNCPEKFSQRRADSLSPDEIMELHRTLNH